MKIACVEPIGMSDKEVNRLESMFKTIGHDFIFYPDRTDDEASLEMRMRGAEVVIVSNIKLDRALLSKCKELKMLSVAFAGIDHIDTDYCKEMGIEVRNAAGYSNVAVSELTIGLMIDALRKITELDYAMRCEKDRCGFLGAELNKKCVGIVGTGNIGSRVAKLLLAFGCNVIAYSRTEKDDLKALGVEYVTLEELLKRSDIITLHTPLNSQTTQLIGVNELKKMKRSAILINCARGNIVDQEALHAALTYGDIAGAAIDVFDYEPPLNPEHIMLQAPNCIVVPHIGYATKEAFDLRINIVINNITNWLENK